MPTALPELRRPDRGRAAGSRCSAVRATSGFAAVTRCGRRSACGGRSRPASGAASAQPTTAAPPRLQYSFEAIEHLRRRLSIDDEAWGRFFASSGIEPLELSYEEDVEPRPAERRLEGARARRASSCRRCWAPDASTVRQSDGLNDAWQAAYDRDATVRSTA